MKCAIVAVILGCTSAPQVQPNVSWDRNVLPLTVYIDESAEAWRMDVEEAIEDLNASVGTRVLLTPIEPIGDIRLAFRADPLERRWTQAVYIRQDKLASRGKTELQYALDTGAVLGARITLPTYGPAPLRSVQLRHEIGHALGLRHSRNSDSIMFPRAWRLGQRWTAADVCALRVARGLECLR